ncbi:Phospholipase A1 precursor Outer membrane phospholipase A [Candidatus Burkholderia verschuerenii]|uniref:Phospholipase A1 n=1 Tax=Candidatus Burkholderia verschuerenii TaxID=242163 RepID=A0A0L0MI12_9BURK|nr:phospholipase A [Candidatus Burkholderia verschuerenii]KND61584.1 Phospholipase A1 precursor Outer membrane phospholipase A [Candidatus Burkholderia verschuerenii]
MAHRLRPPAFTALLFTLTVTSNAHATVAVLQLAREAAASQPLELTLLYTDDDKKPLSIDVPKQLTVNLTNGDLPPAPLQLTRDASVPDRLRLAPGQYRRVKYSAPWPESARGTIKIDPVGFDASPMLVLLNRGENQTQVAAAEHRESQATTPAQLASATAAANTAAVPTTTQDTMLSGRFSSFEPTYFADGKNGDQLAKFQFSFKYRLHLPDDPRSSGFLDNLYFGYTQTAIWNLSADSVPFRDISFQPQLFYYVEDTGVKSPLFTRMGVAAGIGHESNGKGGDESRAINIVFVRPTWEFGDLNDNHLTLSPKFYYYLSKSGNQDIADYRGYADFLIKYGSPDGWQLATTLRKGTKHWYGSVDANLTYPLAKLVGSAWGGYLFVSYFNGYGEDILDYNQRRHWIARIGYSITR